MQLVGTMPHIASESPRTTMSGIFYKRQHCAAHILSRRVARQTYLVRAPAASTQAGRRQRWVAPRQVDEAARDLSAAEQRLQAVGTELVHEPEALDLVVERYELEADDAGLRLLQLLFAESFLPLRDAV